MTCSRSILEENRGIPCFFYSKVVFKKAARGEGYVKSVCVYEGGGSNLSNFGAYVLNE